jgi:thymidylate synthase
MNHFNTIPEAWESLKETCKRFGYRQDIERGSFENTETYRLQLARVGIKIFNPHNFLTLPKTVTIGMIERYYKDYVIGDSKSENEQYTYGERIASQLPTALEMMKNTPNTNQCAISISQPSDIHLSDPPCLREITVKYIPKRGLQLTSFWRSNDLSEAFLLNQGSMAYLLKDFANYTGLKPYCLVYFSDGLHMYNY